MCPLTCVCLYVVPYMCLLVCVLYVSLLICVSLYVPPYMCLRICVQVDRDGSGYASMDEVLFYVTKDKPEDLVDLYR